MARPKPLGFTFLGLLAIMAIAGIAMAVAGVVWSKVSQREKEQELLFIGQAYQQAIASYYLSDNKKQYPAKLEDLILDKRYPKVKRHLRRLYQDPITNGKPWGLIKELGGISGVFSTSLNEPIKKSGFSATFKLFAEATTYQEWAFIYMPSNNQTSTNATQTNNKPPK